MGGGEPVTLRELAMEALATLLADGLSEDEGEPVAATLADGARLAVGGGDWDTDAARVRLLLTDGVGGGEPVTPRELEVEALASLLADAPGEGEGEADAVTLADGVWLAVAAGDFDADGVVDGEPDALRVAAIVPEALRLSDADALADALAVARALAVSLTLADTDGLAEVLAARLGEAVTLCVSDRDLLTLRDGEVDGDCEAVPDGVSTATKFARTGSTRMAQVP